MTSQPRLHQHNPVIQRFGTVTQLPIALPHNARQYSCRRLNRILADTQFLHTLYKKHQWGMRDPTFHQLHLLFDKHAQERLALGDVLAERVQSLGGVAVGDSRRAAQITGVPRPRTGSRTCWRWSRGSSKPTRPSSPKPATRPSAPRGSATTAPTTSSPKSSHQ